MQLPYMYRVTKYDPADRDEHGHYTGTEDTVSDHGEIEAAYLQAVLAFAVEARIERLSVREPQVPSLAHFGLERPLENFGLEGLFPTGLTGFHDGAEVPLDIGLELVRRMLRDSGRWCRLEAEGTFAVHVGWDQYLYVSSSRPCEEALARTCELGLFPERLDASPYGFEAEEDGVQRPGDDDFWADLHRAVANGSAGILEEMYLEGASRWCGQVQGAPRRLPVPADEPDQRRSRPVLPRLHHPSHAQGRQGRRPGVGLVEVHQPRPGRPDKRGDVAHAARALRQRSARSAQHRRYLTWLTNRSKITQNRKKACPSSRHRPPGKQSTNIPSPRPGREPRPAAASSAGA
ncbi:hypothetical protein [Streptomyces mirabilis]|uniref:hypothetical protein n=1 Tax=Streptomyces mirabilis TaxID=68239 RepID=UPI003322116C